MTEIPDQRRVDEPGMETAPTEKASPPVGGVRPEPAASGARPEPSGTAAPVTDRVIERAGDAVEHAGDAVEHAGDAVEHAGDAVDRAGDAVERAAVVSGRIASAVVDRLRNDAEFVADRGTTRIEDEVVEKIAGIAAREVPGVHDLGGDTARFFASMKERVGLGEADGGNRGVSARLDGGEARIGVTLVVEYGVQVYPVTEVVRARVINAVEDMLGLKVLEVNIVVADVHVPDQ